MKTLPITVAGGSATPATSRQHAERALRFANSYTRMGAVLALQPLTGREDWLRMLGNEWETCDNIWQYAPALRRTLKDKINAPYLSAMMNDEERAAHAALPEHFTVYRGAYPTNKDGLSWTLNRDIAERFPSLRRYRQPNAVAHLYQGTVHRQDVVLKLGRDEHEIIAHTVTGITAQPLSLN